MKIAGEKLTRIFKNLGKVSLENLKVINVIITNIQPKNTSRFKCHIITIHNKAEVLLPVILKKKGKTTARSMFIIPTSTKKAVTALAGV